MKLGLLDPVPGAIKLRLATYLDFKKLPTAPQSFGHAELIGDWKVLGNNEYGDCAIAGACHQTMLWCAESNKPVSFDDRAALANYAAITGFDPKAVLPDGSNPTDGGTELGALAHYWRKKGLVDAYGRRHRIVAYVDMNPGDVRELWVATWLFQSVGLGFDLPDSAIEQTKKGMIWDYVTGAESVGGHFVPAVARRGVIGCGITWGATQPFTERFYRKYHNQGIVAFSDEMLIMARSIDGVDDETLRDDLIEIGRT